MTKANKIGQDFNIFSLLLFALPSFFTNLFAQLFKSLDDGLFVSRYVGENALAGLNLVNPLAGVQLGMEHLFSLGACNISARLMGEGKQLEAKQVFSKVCVGGFAVSALFGLIVNIFARPLLTFLGADETLYGYAIYQLRLVYSLAPLSLLNQIFSCYFPTAGKPKMGMYCTIINGVTNIGLDLLLIVVLKMGVVGACLATSAGQLIVFVVGVLFFMNPENEIHFVKPEGDYVKTCLESAKFALPQCINSTSFGVTALISNMMILSIIGSTGVAANAVVSDVRKIFVSGLVGFAVCVGPVVSYNCGNKDIKKLRRILGYIVTIWACGSLVLGLGGIALRKPFISIFMAEDTSVEFYDMTYFALTIEMLATPFISGCVTINRMFIALGDSRTAIILSIFRNLIIKSIVFVLMPLWLGESGIWLSVSVSEFLAFVLGVILIIRNADNYGYGRSGKADRLL